MANYLRSTTRLATLFATTCWHGAGLTTRSMLLGVDGHRSALATRKWARRLIRNLGVRVQVHGDCPDGATVLVANHRSYLDIPLLASVQPTAFLAKAELSRWPLFGPCARSAGTVFVQRGDKASQDTARQALQRRAERGQRVTIFAEGTTFEGPGMLPMRPGAFRIAEQANVGVAPVAIVYQQRRAAYVVGDRFLTHFLNVFAQRRITAHLSFGPVMTGKPSAQLHREADAWLRQELDRLESAAISH